MGSAAGKSEMGIDEGFFCFFLPTGFCLSILFEAVFNDAALHFAARDVKSSSLDGMRMATVWWRAADSWPSSASPFLKDSLIWAPAFFFFSSCGSVSREGSE